MVSEHKARKLYPRAVQRMVSEHAINHDIGVWFYNGWHREDGTVPANLDAVKHLDGLIQTRKLLVTATIVTDRKSPDGQIIARLRKQANEARKTPRGRQAA